MMMTVTGWDEDRKRVHRFLLQPFPKHDFAQPALGPGRPQGEAKASILRTVVQMLQLAPTPDLAKRSMTLFSELLF